MTQSMLQIVFIRQKLVNAPITQLLCWFTVKNLAIRIVEVSFFSCLTVKNKPFWSNIIKCINYWFLNRRTGGFCEKKVLYLFVKKKILQIGPISWVLVLNQFPINKIPLITRCSWNPKFMLSGIRYVIIKLINSTIKH